KALAQQRAAHRAEQEREQRADQPEPVQGDGAATSGGRRGSRRSLKERGGLLRILRERRRR
ncbi:MAG: hypothetical protein L0G94_13755, partial [Brachybacterium sp.]|uniref:hypothetical protein n=1 Tax=Brachybacterium sp. TaxID=1891286 RepID=UPI00264770E3